MSNLAVHMRIASLQVSNEDVNTRQAAVSELAEAWGKLKTVANIVVKASEVAHALGGDGIPVEPLGVEVERAIQKHASAFLYSERPLEVGICSGVAAIELLSAAPGISGWTTADIIAATLWSALDFQSALEEGKRALLRAAVLERARSRSSEVSESSRQRSDVSDFGELTIAIEDEAKVTSNFKKATQATITALRRNAALDREELDFLWWVQLGRSRLLNRPLTSINEPVRLVAAGIEAAGHLRRLPCEIHRDVVLRTLDADPELDLTGLIAAVGNDREALGSPYVSGIVAQAPTAFPLLHALATGSTLADGAKVVRKSSDWGSRALLEAGLARLCANNGPGTL